MRTAECRAPLVCCPEGVCSADLGCLEGGVIPYIDGAADADSDTDTGSETDTYDE